MIEEAYAAQERISGDIPRGHGRRSALRFVSKNYRCAFLQA